MYNDFGCSFPSPQSLKHLSKNDIAALCEEMNDSATFLDKQTITIHIAQRSEMYVITSFESENECKKTEQVPIPLQWVPRSFPDTKTRNKKSLINGHWR